MICCIYSTWGCGLWYSGNLLAKCYTWLLFDLHYLQQDFVRILLPLPTQPREQQGTQKLCLYCVQIQLSLNNGYLWEASKNEMTVWPQQPYWAKHLPNFNNYTDKPISLLLENTLFISGHTKQSYVWCLSTNTDFSCQDGRQFLWRQNYSLVEGLCCFKINCCFYEEFVRTSRLAVIPYCICKDSDYIPILLFRKYQSMLSSVFN